MQKQFIIQDHGFNIIAEKEGFKASNGFRWVIFKDGKVMKRGATVFSIADIKELNAAMKKKEEIIDWVYEKFVNLQKNK